MFWKRKRSPADFKAEVESHLAHEAEQIDAIGSCSDPHAAARRAFGNITAIEEGRYEHEHWMLLDHFLRDLRQGVRQLHKRRGFSLMFVLTLALGIGATSAIFSIVQAVLLRPLPYQDPGRLAMVFAGDPARELQEGRTSLLNFEDWKAQSHSFEDMTLFTPQTFLLGTGGAPERLRSARVPANFWTLLGVRPVLGRLFTLEEERQQERVVLLSYDFWQQQFAGSNRVLGADLIMDGRNCRIIGVMPPEFHFPFADTKVWEPITAHPYWATRDHVDARASFVWLVVGRLRPGVSPMQAQAEMSAIQHHLQLRFPESKMAGGAAVVPLALQSTGKFRLSLWFLFGSVIVILLIACTNAAGLLLARGSTREREFGVRRALGAKSTRLAAQLLTETMVLSLLGGGLGLLLAALAVRIIKASAPADIPRLAEAQLNWQVVLFTVGVTVGAVLFTSLWPAVESNRSQIGSRQWTSTSERRVRELLVTGEFALALMLVSGAGLLIHSFLRLHAVELGFKPDHLLVMRIDLHVGKSNDRQAAYFEDAVDRAKSIPGVQSAGAISGFLRTDPEDFAEVEGRGVLQPGPCEDQIVGSYFETAGIPLLKGRLFSSHDNKDSLLVAIINEAMAKAYWPGEDPIGKRFRFKTSEKWLTVVGVTGNMRRQGIERAIAPQVFLPRRQGNDDMMDVIVRTSTDPVVIAGTIRSNIQAIDKTVAKFNLVTVDQQLGEQTAERQFNTFLISTFAFAAVFLSAIGIYGLLHQMVAQRRNEIGVRLALGASRREIATLVVREGLALALVGAMIGLISSLFLSRLLSRLLFDVSPTDPITFAGAVLVLLTVAAIACWIPSYRATRIDPMIVLRQE